MTIKEAPDFGPGYPSRGEKIGPAWRRVWAALADGNWHQGVELAQRCADGLAPKTVQNLLWQAQRRHVLEREIRSAPGGNRSFPIRTVWYRRGDLVG